MTRLSINLFLITLVFVICGCGQKTESQSADLVLLGGRIRTMNPAQPRAEALAVADGRILAVGRDSKIERMIGPDTRVLHMDERLVLPGLIDGHGHFMSLGESLLGLDLRPPETWEEIVDLVEKAVRQTKPGEWIVGRGWHQDKWTHPPFPAVEGLPVHTRLSRISPDNPVMLIHVSGHGVFVNAKAMERTGIARSTPDPTGGEIVRDARGFPTGMLRETAQDRVRAALAAYRARRPVKIQEAEARKQVELAGQEAVSNGITTFHDMGETFETIDLLKIMAEEGSLPLRLFVCVDEPSHVMTERLADYRLIGYGNEMLTVRAIGERVLDGALGTHGGWLLEPYSDLPRTSGHNVIPVEEIQRSAELAAKHHFQMAIQGIGDRAARELLDIYEEIFRAYPERTDWRWRIEHCQVIHPIDLPRFASMNVIASVRGIFATSDGPWVVNRLGEERTQKRGYQYRSLFESGAVVINGTDPPVEDISPIANFIASVSRKLPDGSIFLPEQRLTREQALKSYTVNPAFAAFEDASKGSIEPGKLADITILSQDILTVPEEELMNTEIVLTLIGGEIKYTGDPAYAPQ